MYVFPIPIRVKPTDKHACTIFNRFALVLHRISTPHLCGCAPVPVRPCFFSQAGERYAELSTKGIPANSRAASNLSIVDCRISCNEQDGTQARNSDSLKYFAVIIVHCLLFRTGNRPNRGFQPLCRRGSTLRPNPPGLLRAPQTRLQRQTKPRHP